jgi:hypothetical protein
MKRRIHITTNQGLKTKEEMWTTLENKKETVTHFLRSALKKKNKVEEGGVLGSRMKNKHESTNLRHKK